jgi:hypothetical protein
MNEWHAVNSAHGRRKEKPMGERKREDGEREARGLFGGDGFDHDPIALGIVVGELLG